MESSPLMGLVGSVAGVGEQEHEDETEKQTDKEKATDSKTETEEARFTVKWEQHTLSTTMLCVDSATPIEVCFFLFVCLFWLVYLFVDCCVLAVGASLQGLR